MTAQVQLLDTVAVSHDMPELGLTRGEVGVVVELLADGVFEVEFCAESGETYATHTLRTEQIIQLHLRGNAFRLTPAAA